MEFWKEDQGQFFLKWISNVKLSQILSNHSNFRYMGIILSPANDGTLGFPWSYYFFLRVGAILTWPLIISFGTQCFLAHVVFLRSASGAQQMTTMVYWTRGNFQIWGIRGILSTFSYGVCQRVEVKNLFFPVFVLETASKQKVLRNKVAQLVKTRRLVFWTTF